MTSSTLRHTVWILRGNPVTAIAAAGAFILCLLAIIGPWIVPFVVQLVGEYVVEIVQAIGEALHDIDGPRFGAFARENPAMLA